MRPSVIRLLPACLVPAFTVVSCTPPIPTIKPTPPPQPVSGPGGAEYRHEGATESVHGEGSEQYWIFEPAIPTPDSAPLVVFTHGWSGMHPLVYGEWISHLVKRGNIVVYPRYQANLATPSAEFTNQAIQAVIRAIAVLETEGHVRPELDKFALVGHSSGALITANIAALAATVGLPAPKAIMIVNPGVSTASTLWPGVPLEDLSTIPADALLLVVVSREDALVGDRDAKRIFRAVSHIPAENKDFITVQSDDHGDPPLIADHFAAVCFKASAEVETVLGSISIMWQREGIGRFLTNALDYYGFWKLFDGLCDAAFYGTHREYALGNTLEQRFMGQWSDSILVKELLVTDEP